MQEKIEELHQTMRRLEQLLIRFELDTAAGLHTIDYEAIARECDRFHAQMKSLASAAPVGPSDESTGVHETR
jgi:hypothetical protein